MHMKEPAQQAATSALQMKFTQAHTDAHARTHAHACALSYVRTYTHVSQSLDSARTSHTEQHRASMHEHLWRHSVRVCMNTYGFDGERS